MTIEAPALPGNLLDISAIYLEPTVESFERGREILARFPHAKAQMKAEIIFLTHNAGLHEVNLEWHPRAEQFCARLPAKMPYCGIRYAF